MNEEYGNIPDGFLLNSEETEELRQNKRYLTAQATQKLRKMKAKQQAEKIVEATMEHTLRPKGGNRERVLATAFRELLEQCGYGQDGLLVVNIRDILGIIETLEELAQGSPQGHQMPYNTPISNQIK
jgi:hypothetical protein